MFRRQHKNRREKLNVDRPKGSLARQPSMLRRVAEQSRRVSRDKRLSGFPDSYQIGRYLVSVISSMLARQRLLVRDEDGSPSS
jgi:hypothetical protein